MTTSTYNSEEHIIYLTHSGKVNIKEAIKMLRLLKQKYNHLDYVYILEDSRESSFNFNLTEIPTLLSEVKKNLFGILEVRHADLVNTPINTALCFMYGQLAKPIKNYSYRAFSTAEAAKIWLRKGIYFQQ